MKGISYFHNNISIVRDVCWRDERTECRESKDATEETLKQFQFLQRCSTAVQPTLCEQRVENIE